MKRKEQTMNKNEIEQNKKKQRDCQWQWDKDMKTEISAGVALRDQSLKSQMKCIYLSSNPNEWTHIHTSQ